ncbi:MAG TPA: carboxypeptidase regulatory-like domain-containing protein [Longimicrobiaceae bacterium]|nr:carboxypeptidase regulatory-like domain-containing protein [Longimicrobiaceae bacterium]
MTRLKPLALITLLLLAFGCRDSNHLTSPHDPRGLASSADEFPALDTTPPPFLRPPFTLLPPLAPQRDLPGVFDAGLAPVVEICHWTGSECAVPMVARFTTTSGPGSETVRVGSPEDHYIVNWHTDQFALDPSHIYRIRVLLAGNEIGQVNVKVVNTGKELKNVDTDQYIGLVNGRTLPIKFWIQKMRRLTVARAVGVQGTPAEQDTLLPYGTTVRYGFAPAPGYEDLAVMLDGEMVPATGVLAMDTSHVLLADADETLVLTPGDEELVRSARAILTATDKIAAFQVHLDQINALYNRVGEEEANRRVGIVSQLAYDLVADSTALRQAHEALGNNVFTPSERTTTQTFSSATMSATLAPRTTTYYAINGILNTPTDAGRYQANVTLALAEAGIASEAQLYYNRTFLYQHAEKYQAGQCYVRMQNEIRDLNFGRAVQRASQCTMLIARDLVRFFADVAESGRQVASLYYNVDLNYPSPLFHRDGEIFADTLRRAEANANVILVAHSQGNLITQLGLRGLSRRDPRFETGAYSCVGVTSLSAPITHSPLVNVWPTLAPGSLAGIVMKYDVILFLGLNHFPRLETSLTRRAQKEMTVVTFYGLMLTPFTAGWSLVAIPLWRLYWAAKIHASDSYLRGRGARQQIKDALVAQTQRVPQIAGCEATPQVHSVEVTPAAATIAAGGSVQLAAVARDAAGNAIEDSPITWSSSAGSIATVSSTGNVTGIASGTATITASSGGKSGTSTISIVEGGTLTGRVVHAETRAGIGAATVTFSGGGLTQAATTASDGSYQSGKLPAGSYTATVSAKGFVSVTLYNAVVQNSQTTTLETIPLVPASSFPGGISGSIRNARNNAAIAGATVELRSGMSALDGPAVAVTTSDAAGSYRFTGLPAGTYSILGKAGGFVDGVQTGVVIGDREVAGQNLTLSPSTEDITIVLRWGATPSDLDSHLTGPTESGSRFHVYYASKGSLLSSPFAALDIDDVTSYGPETITISRQFSGTYRYSVHDYTNRFANPSSALPGSGAQVRVYRGGSLVAEFNVPNQPGTLWTVFELEGSTIRPVNAMQYVSNPSQVGAMSTSSSTSTDAELIGSAVAEHPKQH